MTAQPEVTMRSVALIAAESLREMAEVVPDGAPLFLRAADELEALDAQTEGAKDDAIRMAHEVASTHITAYGIDRTRCMCGEPLPCPTRRNAQDVFERWSR